MARVIAYMPKERRGDGVDREAVEEQADEIGDGITDCGLRSVQPARYRCGACVDEGRRGLAERDGGRTRSWPGGGSGLLDPPMEDHGSPCRSCACHAG